MSKFRDFLNEATDPRIDLKLIKKAQSQLQRVKQFVSQVEASLGHSWSGKYRMSQQDVRSLDKEVKQLVKDIEKINDQTGLKSESLERTINERDFSNAHYAIVKGKMYGDTQSIYILDALGGRIQHLGFGDFGTSNPIKLPGIGEVKVEYVRADGTPAGVALIKAGFVGRPHYIDFKGVSNPEKAAKALAKIYGQKGAVEVNA